MNPFRKGQCVILAHPEKDRAYIRERNKVTGDFLVAGRKYVVNGVNGQYVALDGFPSGEDCNIDESCFKLASKTRTKYIYL
jgi:hypothetical protein